MSADGRSFEFDFHELVADSFAGGGGASTGIRMALGRCPDVAVNHDGEALAMHEANHPNTVHIREDVWAVDPMAALGHRQVGLLWASPDCFPAGTLVLTRDGYTPIEEIQVGDEVLTHRARWRAVTETSSTVRPQISIKGHGHPGIAVSPEHPFLARLRKDIWQTEPRGYKRTLEPQDWMPASALDKGWYWSTLTDYPSADVPSIEGRGMAINDKLLWFVGRYIGDGWTRLTDVRAEVVITCGKHEVERLRALLDQWPRASGRAEFNELAWHERHTGTAYQFATNHRGLVEWLRKHFGHRAESKRIPAWALGMAPELRRALLAGYLSADGWDNDTFSECRTVSKALAFGIKALLGSLGKTVTVHRLANTSVIDGREVNAREIYMLRWRAQLADKHGQTFREDGMEWCPIREQEDLGRTAEVFNIGVADDESYLVEGIVVHNCKHFSKAKGGKPVSKKIRGLAWVVTKWAAKVKPRVIIMENVEEFRTWGPLQQIDGQWYPDPARKGETFQRFVARLERLGYAVEHRELRACDYGAPTIRKRLFLIARRDGRPIVWPAPTHGNPKSLAVQRGKLQPWRTAADCIDWTIPCPSIFERKKPLADATLRRIARGVMRYVVNAADPFIVPIANYGSGLRVNGIDEPLTTITANPKGGAHALVVPHLMTMRNAQKPFNGADEPTHTITSGGAGISMVAATLVQTGYGEREGQAPRALDIEQPLGTVVGGGAKHAVVAAFLAQHNTMPNGGIHAGHDAREPVSTISASGAQQQVVTSHLIKLRGTCADGQPVDEPAPTITASGTHAGEVRAFLVKYYGNERDGVPLAEPMHTLPTKDRMGLVTVHGEAYQIVDIGMRMLTPRELATAQGFPPDYIIDRKPDGTPLTKTAQVRMIGNSVAPPIAAALVKANFVHEKIKSRRAA